MAVPYALSAVLHTLFLEISLCFRINTVIFWFTDVWLYLRLLMVIKEFASCFFLPSLSLLTWDSKATERCLLHLLKILIGHDLWPVTHCDKIYVAYEDLVIDCDYSSFHKSCFSWFRNTSFYSLFSLLCEHTKFSTYELVFQAFSGCYNPRFGPYMYALSLPFFLEVSFWIVSFFPVGFFFLLVYVCWINEQAFIESLLFTRHTSKWCFYEPTDFIVTQCKSEPYPLASGGVWSS